MDIGQLRKRFVPMSESMFYILSSLTVERHGYGIMQHVEKLTNGRIVLGAGTIYQSLSKLENGKLIAATRESDRKKEYLITETGRIILAEEARRICEMYEVAKELI